MVRTTLDIDPQVLDELKRLQSREKKSLGRLASDLLAQALAEYTPPQKASTKLCWNSQPMGARVDLSDKEAIYAQLDGDL